MNVPYKYLNVDKETKSTWTRLKEIMYVTDIESYLEETFHAALRHLYKGMSSPRGGQQPQQA